MLKRLLPMRAPLLALLLSLPAAAEDLRYDHKGAVGLLLGGAPEAMTRIDRTGASVGGVRGSIDLGGTLAVGDRGDELAMMVRASLGAVRPEAALAVFYRTYFGPDRIHTFFDLGGALQLASVITVGPRAGGGVQYELSPVAGLYGGMALNMGVGISGLRLGGELFVGLQLRSYLLE